MRTVGSKVGKQKSSRDDADTARSEREGLVSRESREKETGEEDVPLQTRINHSGFEQIRPEGLLDVHYKSEIYQHTRVGCRSRAAPRDAPPSSVSPPNVESRSSTILRSPSLSTPIAATW